MQGFLNIHKPSGLTSFDVIRQIKRKIPRRCKIGHLGTLDPMATGVLPVAIGSATRLIEYVTESTKVYIAAFILGGVSDTQDAWGRITILHERVTCSEAELVSVFAQFSGEIQQIPPMYSAVHHNGQRLYELARQGLEVARKPRPATIEAIELLQIDQTQDLPQVTIKVTCSRGTYIRTLVHDIGAYLGTGAYLKSLIRIQSGNFVLDQAVKLQELMDREDIEPCLLAVDYPLSYMAIWELNAEQVLDIKQGRAIKAETRIQQPRVRLYEKQRLTAIAYYDSETGMLRPEKVFI